MEDIFKQLDSLKWENFRGAEKQATMFCKLGIVILCFEWLGTSKYRIFLQGKNTTTVFTSNPKDKVVFKFMRYIGAL